MCQKGFGEVFRVPSSSQRKVEDLSKMPWRSENEWVKETTSSQPQLDIGWELKQIKSFLLSK